MAEQGHKIIARNRRARHDYEIVDTLEAGIVLRGTEIKSIRAGKVNLKEGYVRIQNGEVFLHGVNIPPYEQAGVFNHDPVRVRKLLLHHQEIDRLRARLEEKGLTAVPLSLYLLRGRAKVEVGVGRGRQQHDHRETARRKDDEREAHREAARHRRGS